LLALALTAGCAGAAYERADEAGTVAPGDDTRIEAEPPLAADPYTETAGGPEAEAPPPARVLFRVPDAPPQPVPAAERADLPPSVRLGVAQVAGGALADPSLLLLALEAELSREHDLEAVLGLGAIEDQPRVGFADLAAVGAAREHDLLLIDFAEALSGPGREAYLFDCREGDCLARWPAGSPPPESLPEGLLTRIARAYAVVSQ
jgi:hypothetical protein